jgi:hypothetical protein
MSRDYLSFGETLRSRSTSLWLELSLTHMKGRESFCRVHSKTSEWDLFERYFHGRSRDFPSRLPSHPETPLSVELCNYLKELHFAKRFGTAQHTKLLKTTNCGNLLTIKKER